MKFMKHVTASVAALMLAVPASAQMFGDAQGTDLDPTGFQTGLNESGMYDAWDRDATPGLSENEFATGVYHDWDRDRDMAISQEEYDAGVGRWYGDGQGADFATADADQSGAIEREEFGSVWDDEYYSGWDADSDGVLSEEEYGTGLYNAADTNEDMVISVEEEGWFEGWFDGDDVEAEIEQVGDVM